MITFIILLPFLGAFAEYLAGRKKKSLQNLLTCLITGAELLTALGIFIRVNVLSGELTAAWPRALSLGLTFRMDGFRSLYALIAAIMWFITSLFSGEYFRSEENTNRYYFFILITLGSTVGVFCADDLYTTYMFFEVMSMASYPWVAQSESKQALKAAETYVGMSILGGMVSLMGMFLMYHKLGTLSFAAFRKAADSSLVPAGLLSLFGFAVKAGAFPVHVWLPKAHPVAPSPASALLSGILTKTGIFGILAVCLNLFPANRAVGHMLMAVALTTMLLGAILALFSTNLKRVLACSSMSQIGYILTGLSCAVLLGEHGSMAAAGAVAHMVNHSLLKLLLFLCAGCVHMNLHKLELNDVCGFGRGKPLLHFCFLSGALGLAGVPLFNGYVSKTLIHESIVELGSAYRIPEWIFLLAAGLTTGYMLKLYVALFIQKNKNPKVQKDFDGMNRRYMDRLSAFALTASAVMPLVLGIFSGYTLLPAVRLSAPFLNTPALGMVHIYAPESLLGGGITILIGTGAYLFVVRKWMYSGQKGYLDRWPKGLDLEDSFYRPVLCRGLYDLLYKICFLPDRLIEGRVIHKWLGPLMGKILSLMDRVIEGPVILRWLGPLMGKAFSVMDRVIEGPVIFRWTGPLMGKICYVLDRVIDGRFVHTFLANTCVVFFRLFDEITDHLALFIDELLFKNSKAMHRMRKESIFIGMACFIADRVLAAYRFLSHKPPDERAITDMRYGSFVTNAISFGLLLCAIGVLGAIVYVFVSI